jgi:hypothetical protein
MDDLPSIHDKLNHPPILEFEGFVIRPLDGWNLWFEHSSGEGTQIRRIEFLACLIKLFKEKF